MTTTAEIGDTLTDGDRTRAVAVRGPGVLTRRPGVMGGGGLTRRELLRAALGAATLGVGAFVPARFAAAAPTRAWSNWSGSQVSRPARWFTPTSEENLVAEIRRTTEALRTVGAGHSFSALAKTDDTLISIERLSGVIGHDAATLQATLWAGTRIRDAGDALWERGQALVNQGDIDSQTLAGAIGTSTHGTGIKLGSFSSLVRGLRLVTATGDIVECAPDRDADVFHAACTSFGALGVVTQVRMQNRASYHLEERTYSMDLDEVLRQHDALRDAHRHFEFWAFFKASTALVKTLSETDAAPTPPPAIDIPVDLILWMASETAHTLPPLDGAVQRSLMAVYPSSTRVDRSYRIFPSPRSVRFNEMEYELPAEKGLDCVKEILAAVKARDLNTLFPIEYRLVAADDCWLSPFYGRASASISIHQYHKHDYGELFDLVEPIFWRYGGRPHWGKLHTLTAKQLAPLYPKWDAFQAVRRRLDPRGRFLNDHLRRVLGVT